MSNTRVYATRIKNNDILLHSSSGGMFTALSDAVLETGGAVACTKYDYANYKAEYQLILNKVGRDEARGSKYFQSSPGDIFQKCAEWVDANPDQYLLFIGMGCQADGFRKYAELKGIADHVYVVDIICHGSPSPQLWSEYAQHLEECANGNITDLTFKDKRNGWKSPTALAKIKGKEYLLGDYTKIFYNRCALRPSCYVCPYATVERETDITIGDFWGIENVMPEFYSEEGNSLVLLHTPKGQQLFEKIQGSLDVRESNSKECLQPNLVQPTPVSERREEFWEDYCRKGIEFVIKKYGTMSLKKKIKNKLCKIFG